MLIFNITWGSVDRGIDSLSFCNYRLSSIMEFLKIGW